LLDRGLNTLNQAEKFGKLGVKPELGNKIFVNFNPLVTLSKNIAIFSYII
jgi:hypothetical protein